MTIEKIIFIGIRHGFRTCLISYRLKDSLAIKAPYIIEAINDKHTGESYEVSHAVMNNDLMSIIAQSTEVQQVDFIEDKKKKPVKKKPK